ncbi:MAG: shikimate dehydrogenase [Kiritimatiellae bacterium]|nr:shikimate dehydrogenase [Kiritimatiellia bacterium]
MKLSGHTEPFAVLGHPIGHTLSPIMHNASLASLDMDAIYLAFDVHPDKLMSVLPSMQEMGFGGVNLTVPLKEVAFNGLDQLDDTAKNLGAVNTVEFLEDGTIRGHNTDGYGFLAAVKEAFNCSVKDLSIFILGSGGAGRAVAITCAVEGAKQIAVADLDEERTERLKVELADIAPATEVVVVPNDKELWSASCLNADLVVQATPVGMNPDDPSLLEKAAFRDGQMVFDLVYMYPQTAFMKAAEAVGAKAANGLDMLLYQGARAFTIWTGKEPDVDAMRKALQDSVYK